MRRNRPQRIKEAPDECILRAPGAFPLVDLHVDTLLVVRDGAIDLGPSDGDSRIPANDGGEMVGLSGFRVHLVDRLHPQRMSGHVEEDLTDGLPRDEPPLDGGPQGHTKIRIDGMHHRPVEVLGKRCEYGRHARSPSDQDELPDVFGIEVRFFQDFGDLCHRPLDEVLGEGFEQLTTHLEIEVERTPVDHGDRHFVDPGVGLVGQGDLGPLGDVQKTHLEADILNKISRSLQLFQLAHQEILEPLIEIITAEGRVTARGQDFLDVPLDFEHGDVEGPPTEVVHQNEGGIFLLLNRYVIVNESGRRGLVDDPQHFEARKLAGTDRGPPLGVVEISRNRDHNLLDGLPQLLGGPLCQMLEDRGGDLLRRKALFPGAKPGIFAHQPFHRRDGVLRKGSPPIPGERPHETAAVPGLIADHGREDGSLPVDGNCRWNPVP